MAGNDTFTAPKVQAKLARLLAGLEQQRMTRDELQCLLGVSKPATRRYIEHLRGQGAVYIAAWRPSERGRFAAVYAIGSRKDVPEPAGMSRTERNAAAWRRIKADRDAHDRVKSVARVAGTIKRARAKPQPWFAALMGVA